MTDQIRKALAQLDVDVDDHWTTDGLPRIEVVAKLGDINNLKRGDITDAAPEFTRSSPSVEVTEAPALKVNPETATEDPDLVEVPETDPELDERDLVEVPETDPELDERDLVEVPETDPDDKSSYEAAIKALQHNQRSAELARAEAQNFIDETKVRITELSEERDLQHPPMRPAEMVQAYQRSQREQRAGEVERAAAGRAAAGIRPGPSNVAPAGVAPIDAAMARKTQRGTERPKR